YRDPAARRSLMEDGALPEEPGGLAVAARAIEDNDIYDTDLKLIFYDDPVFGSYQRRFDAIFAQPRYTDIVANLRYFAALYRRIDAERRPLAEALENGHESDRAAFSAFYRRFYAYVDHESAEVDARLAALARPAAIAGATP
ncbi:MAG: hypothetical protein ACREFL_01720, partial [Stellaceae bacterium]